MLESRLGTEALPSYRDQQTTVENEVKKLKMSSHPKEIPFDSRI
jgi:hypothetical protein